MLLYITFFISRWLNKHRLRRITHSSADRIYCKFPVVDFVYLNESSYFVSTSTSLLYSSQKYKITFFATMSSNKNRIIIIWHPCLLLVRFTDSLSALVFSLANQIRAKIMHADFQGMPVCSFFSWRFQRDNFFGCFKQIFWYVSKRQKILDVSNKLFGCFKEIHFFRCFKKDKFLGMLQRDKFFWIFQRHECFWIFQRDKFF